MVKQERAARTRRALIRAAAEVFAEEGYTPASLASICKRAGVSSGALHFHFESKKMLAGAVEEQAARIVGRVIREAEERPDGDALQVLVDATHGLVRRIAEDAVVHAAFELCGDPARGSDWAPWRQWQSWVEEALRRIERDGLLARGVSAADAATAVVAVTAGFEVLSGENERWLSEERVTGFWNLLLPRLTEGRVPRRARPGAAASEPAAPAP
ncbi:ScbR family autoregulator-binding transcription factor [Streptomyces xinghaiensis]|uniref:TetR/AcrR family transcriptional regulator n=1 Tax=Streptomyces xinghaiensis TaxID=1038928 RepID=A0A3R7H5V8_9ACTN|nr:MULTISPECIES: ScbR family autoregulator-binding transcription factor [Streptomyces]OFA40103.1 hypothetical protein BEN35_25960 [Streptomyces fradiae]PQM19478.1 TetR/AcrR family transcriptional regulator [Streptomyces xinghaiensis]RKM89882.1 TetR/AcrR family transcriptional regulator [Streptomyces xinghaiensis]RNC68203.1 TetR/AcrR family transcriptional regulator [Streptomyces xinghaiensis]